VKELAHEGNVRRILAADHSIVVERHGDEVAG
jgi:hypothetical protein